MSSASSGAEGPQTPEDVARDQPEPEIDELGRVRVANEYATIIASRQAYGQLLSPGQRSRMELWVERLPYDWHFEDANTACLIAVTVYKDWLDWSESKAFSWLDKLTKFERRFRIAGVAYHKIPYALRHASTVTNSYRINPVILVRLSQIFETDRPRAQQSFFRPWIEISNAAKEVLVAPTLMEATIWPPSIAVKEACFGDGYKPSQRLSWARYNLSLNSRKVSLMLFPEMRILWSIDTRMRWRKRCESSAQHYSVSLEEGLMIQQLIQPTRLCELLLNSYHVCVPSPIKFTISSLRSTFAINLEGH
jgi:hypothetical protein